MDIRGNYLSVPDAAYPDNQLWDPQVDPNQRGMLVPFLPSPAGMVGIGLAATEKSLDATGLSKGIPVRLSTFTINDVFVDYAVDTEDGPLTHGTLHFVPGETVKRIGLDVPSPENLCQVDVTLSNPVNAELTGFERITYQGKCTIGRPLIVEGDSWRYFKGTEEPPTEWNSPGFDDSSWLAGPTPIGFEAGTGYESRIATNLSDMRNEYRSVYARRQFVVDDPSRLTSLTLTMDYDDGYIAYLNGVRVAAQSAPTSPEYNQPATSSHEACCGTGTPTGPCPPEPIDLSSYIKDLVPGTNVLAVQVHNQSLSSSDFIFIPELFGTTPAK
jgi:hypothetical protein